MRNGNESPRLFFALYPAAPARDALHALARHWVPAAAGVLVQPANLHITLVFLGALTPGQRQCVSRLAAGTRSDPVTVTVDRVGYWPGPAVVWAGASRTPDALPRLVESLRAGVVACAIAVDPRPFELHVTLVRQASRPVPSLQLPEPVTLSFDRFVLMASRHAAGGVCYTVIESWPLAPADSA